MSLAASLSADCLRDRLAAFDGNAVSLLSELQAQDTAPETLTARLIQVLGETDEMVQRGASWILLDQMKTGRHLSEDDWRAVAASAAKLTDWQATLHLLQMLSLQAPPADTAQTFAAVAEPYLDHKRPFLRAWAISALATLAGQDASLRAVSNAAIDAGLEDPAASVRARAKKVEPPQ